MSFYGRRPKMDKSAFANVMRQKPTRCESLLHNALLTAFFPYQTQIVHQYVIGPFIGDFKVKHFIIEVDGHSHNGQEAAAYDARRSTYIKNKGYSILRVSNADVLNDAAKVASHIFKQTGPHLDRKSTPIQITYCPPSRSFPQHKERKKPRDPYVIGLTRRRY